LHEAQGGLDLPFLINTFKTQKITMSRFGDLVAGKKEAPAPAPAPVAEPAPETTPEAAEETIPAVIEEMPSPEVPAPLNNPVFEIPSAPVPRSTRRRNRLRK